MSNEKNNSQNALNNNEENKEVKTNISELNDEAISTKKLQSIGIIVFGIIILILLALKFFSNKNSDEPVKETAIGTKIEQKDFDFKEPPVKTFQELVLKEEKEVETNETLQNTDNTNPFVIAQTKTSFTPKVYKSSSSLLINNTNPSSNSNNLSEEDKPVDFTDPNYNYSFDENGKIIRTPKNEFNKDYELGAFTPKIAKLNKYDPNLLLPKGTYIGCSLNTKLVSTIKGSISCTVSENIYSQNGNTLLIEKGSKISGFFNSGQLNDGMDRIFVVWQEIRTPNNIDIPVSSGATDELGGSGIQGYIDHHWLQRFGAAILLSVIDDAMNVALNGETGNRNNQNKDYTENTRETTRDMADTALQKFINIEPTLYRNHGDLVAVYVNRDIDFSKVYKLNYIGNKIIK